MLDLHVHSVHSDGEYPPARLVAMARDAGLNSLAITDHDNIDGLNEALRAGRESDLRVVTGVEFSVQGGLHMLGYAFDPLNDAIAEKVRWTRQMRDERNKRMLARLQRLGYDLTMDDVAREAGGGSLGRVHMALALVRKSLVTTVRYAFSNLIGNDGPAYVPKIRMTPAEAISVIKAAGGYAVWAHPMLRLDPEQCARVAAGLASQGLSGIEAHYPTHDPDDTAFLIELCRQCGVFATAGSDYHGPRVKPDNDLGMGWNHVPLPDVELPFLS